MARPRSIAALGPRVRRQVAVRRLNVTSQAGSVAVAAIKYLAIEEDNRLVQPMLGYVVCQILELRSLQQR